MRVLLVTPAEISSGEAITALHMAEELIAAGDEVQILASAFALRLLQPRLGEHCQPLGRDPVANRRAWDATLRAFRPDAIVFADYPLCFFSSGVAPFADRRDWAARLDTLDACLITLDHLGFAQRARSLFFGPPHLSFHAEMLPPLPTRMRILLPCPMHEPGPVAGRRGVPFRAWSRSLTVDETQRAEIRRQLLHQPDELLIFHSVAHWAQQIAATHRLPYYRYLPEILAAYLADLPQPVTLVSLNTGELLPPRDTPSLHIRNIATLPLDQYDALLFSADLLLTENRMSTTLGKAICGLTTSVVLANSFRLRELAQRADPPLRRLLLHMEAERPGAIYPYHVFPNGWIDELNQLRLFTDNSITETFAMLEIYGGTATRDALHALLLDPATRAALRDRQRAYVDALARLPDAVTAIHALVERGSADPIDAEAAQ